MGNAGNYGGGVRIDGSLGNITLSNNTITGNSAIHDGGGVYKVAGSTFTLINNTITGNTALIMVVVFFPTQTIVPLT